VAVCIAFHDYICARVFYAEIDPEMIEVELAMAQ
jgi:hypothetical protein